LAGSLQNTAIKIGEKHFGEQRKYVELHVLILAGCGMSGKRAAGSIIFILIVK
jgi:hypothetical protein